MTQSLSHLCRYSHNLTRLNTYRYPSRHCHHRGPMHELHSMLQATSTVRELTFQTPIGRSFASAASSVWSCCCRGWQERVTRGQISLATALILTLILVPNPNPDCDQTPNVKVRSVASNRDPAPTPNLNNNATSDLWQMYKPYGTTWTLEGTYCPLCAPSFEWTFVVGPSSFKQS